MPDALPPLSRLAAAYGVATSYEDWAGREVAVPPASVVAALSALGVDAGSEAAVGAALLEHEDAAWRDLLPPVVVVRGTTGSVVVHVAESTPRVELVVELEDGGSSSVQLQAELADRRNGRLRLRVALDGLPPGWHRLRAVAGEDVASAVLLVAPQRLAPVVDRRWGWMLQLYSLRSEDSWGIGDLSDLHTAVERFAADGAGLVLLNPLHAESPVLPQQDSPYSPSSRLFRSPLYLRPEALPEHGVAPPEVQSAVAALRPTGSPERIDRDAAWTAKLAALELLWPLHDPQELAAFTRSGLDDFALFCALAEVHGLPWQQWPTRLRHPAAPAVAAARQEHAERVAFWRWVQLRVETAVAAVDALPVVHDLAVGVDAGGADAWALQDAIALGTTVGAPPDSFNQQGQDWGLPPWRPDRLRELAYAPFRDMVRACLRSAGGLRIDHVMGLFRLWWVPAGSSAAAGTYVSYDAEALLAVLVLEAERAGAFVVGEDLGTVQKEVRTSLSAAGVLGSAVLWFEQDPDGAYLPPAGWRADALATVTTHDLPTAAGYLADEHVRVRAELGQLGHPVEVEQARVAEDRDALVAMLREEGLVEAADGDVALAMHLALVRSPSVLVLAALGDAVGDLRQPNLPGTVDEYPNWRLPVADADGTPLLLEQLLASPGVRRLTEVLRGVAPEVR